MQASFSVGEWQVEPRQRLMRNGRRQVRLEPKSLAVLCALVEAGGEPLSRDALIAAAWPGQVVSDDAVNRQVAKLRQALGDDPRTPRYIETIPKTGFRLLPHALSRPPEPVAPAHRAWWRWWPLATAAVAAAVVAGLALERRAVFEPEAELTQITAAPGLEIHPSPSPSGRAVVYAARPAEHEDYELFVHETDTGTSVRVTESAGHDVHPVWSPEGERIAFLRIARETCGVYWFNLFDLVAKLLADCREAADGGGLGWSADGRSLLFSDRDAPGDPFSLRRLDIATGETMRIIEPERGTLGDTTPRALEDGTIAFLRVRTLGVEDLHLLGADGAVRRLTFDEGKIHGLTGHRDGVVVASNRRGGLFGLWQVPLTGSGLRRLAAPPGADAPASNGRDLVFEQWSSQVDLWSVPLTQGGEGAPLLGSTRWDWWPATSPDGSRLAWTSDRSGAAELWVSAADGSQARRLTRFGGPYTQAAVWTPDGGGLVVAAPVEGQFDLFSVNAASGRAVRITRTPEDEAAPLFAPDGRLMFRRDDGGRSELVDESGRLVVPGVRRARFAPDGSLWFVRPGRPGLWRIAGGEAPERVTRALETVDWQNWWVDDEGVHMVVRPDPDRPLLARLDPASGALTTVRELPDMLYKSGLARVGTSVVYAREVRREADLYRLRSTQ